MYALSTLALLACTPLEALQPLTEIAPTPIELNVFTATLRGALAKVGGLPDNPVVHIVGATDVEDQVDWSPLCQDGFQVILAGPQVAPLAKMIGPAVVQRERTGQECVTAIRRLYSRDVVQAALGEVAAVESDVIVLYNADLYMHYWRRTLAELLQMGKPIIVTMYCKYETLELGKLFDNFEVSFSREALATCDQAIKGKYRGDADDYLASSVGKVPKVQMLWGPEQNPHAHEPPRNCLTRPYTHGVRNSFWLAFTGLSKLANKDDPERKEEL